MDPLKYLPQDVLFYLLQILPDESILRLRSLNTKWKNITDDENFWKRRTQDKFPENENKLVPGNTWKKLYFESGRVFSWDVNNPPSKWFVSEESISSGGGYGNPGLVTTKQKLVKGINRIRISIQTELNWTYVGIAQKTANFEGVYPQGHQCAYLFKSHHNHAFIELWKNNVVVHREEGKKHGFPDTICVTADLVQSLLRVEVVGKNIFSEVQIPCDGDDWYFCSAFNSDANSIIILPFDQKKV